MSPRTTDIANWVGGFIWGWLVFGLLACSAPEPPAAPVFIDNRCWRNMELGAPPEYCGVKAVDRCVCYPCDDPLWIDTGCPSPSPPQTPARAHTEG